MNLVKPIPSYADVYYYKSSIIYMIGERFVFIHIELNIFTFGGHGQTGIIL